MNIFQVAGSHQIHFLPDTEFATWKILHSVYTIFYVNVSQGRQEFGATVICLTTF